MRRAEGFLTQRDNELNDKRVELGVNDDIASIANRRFVAEKY